jgi:hypothetical protein
MGLTGSDAMFPMGGDRVHSVTVTIRIGLPIAASDLHEHTGGNRQLTMDTVGMAVADLLPPRYRGVYGDDDPAIEEARRVFNALRKAI